MLFQPAVIALLLASLVSVAMLAASVPFAFDVIRHWDIGSGSERQLALERRTYLFSTLLGFVFATQLVSLLLFVFNADKMAVMFVGAMCAVGTLNVNAFGFPALMAQMLVFFLAATWLVVNHADNQAEDYPLVRVKYVLLIAMLPFLLGALALQFEYFLNLKANVITSCCGSLFSEDKQSLTGDASALPPRQAMALFYGALALAIGGAVVYARKRRGGHLVALFSIAAFVAALAGILSFVSLYIYEAPHHHCPFCILKPEYDYQGYWLYIPLFTATAAGLGVGALQPFARVASMKSIVPETGRRLAWVAAGGFALFALVASIMMWRSKLILIGS